LKSGHTEDLCPNCIEDTRPSSLWTSDNTKEDSGDLNKAFSVSVQNIKRRFNIVNKNNNSGDEIPVIFQY